MLDPPHAATGDRRDPWLVAWRITTGDGALAVVLLACTLAMAATVWFPQLPVGASSAYGRELFTIQTRFGDAAQSLQALGLFHVTRTVGFRALLAVLAGLLLLRTVECAGHLWEHRRPVAPVGDWRALPNWTLDDAAHTLRRRRYRVTETSALVQADRWPWGELFPLLAHVGALLVLSSLLVNEVWGWQVTRITVQEGQRVLVPGTEQWVALDQGDLQTRHSRGIQAPVDERGPGLRISAVDVHGQALRLRQTPEGEGADQLLLALVEDPYLNTREAQFAIPDSNLVFRVTPADESVAAPILIQTYRSPSGELAGETTITGQGQLTVDGVTIHVDAAPYAIVTAAYHPGLWLALAGLVALSLGLLGTLGWPARRLWLRQESDQPVMSTEALPPVPDRGREQ
ncbi:MAG: hypothetical protein GX601_03465 [Anaerolineales bacterium]|nr:hypothetical protein [Anaerolineales bacterium]